MKRIAILACWFGPYPWYFPYFINSCSYNSTIDFYIITDNTESNKNQPTNVKVVFKTLEQVKSIASDKLKLNVNIDYPYKLCDFKPAYGFLFSDIIKGYDFWGQSDLDVIFGNMRAFLTNRMLNKYEFISLRHDYTTGCFALYRNNKKMNSFFMRSKDYRLVFESSKHYCFDECNFVWDELTAGKSIFELETEIESFTHIVKAAALKNEIQAHFDFILIEGFTGRVVFDNGRIYYKNKFEGILFHLFWLKKVYNPNKQPMKVPGKYYISPTRIYHSRTNKSLHVEK